MEFPEGGTGGQTQHLVLEGMDIFWNNTLVRRERQSMGPLCDVTE